MLQNASKGAPHSREIACMYKDDNKDKHITVWKNGSVPLIGRGNEDRRNSAHCIFCHLLSYHLLILRPFCQSTLAQRSIIL